MAMFKFSSTTASSSSSYGFSIQYTTDTDLIVIILFLYAGSFLEEGGFPSLNCLFLSEPPIFTIIATAIPPSPLCTHPPVTHLAYHFHFFSCVLLSFFGLSLLCFAHQPSRISFVQLHTLIAYHSLHFSYIPTNSLPVTHWLIWLSPFPFCTSCFCCCCCNLLLL
ncbi:hypothetical protein BJ912DRAFT_589771 [Pholiota molesta]|nr:hypothetical protein BJ912DRAFT_589771 [Pholiota molesta]